MTTNNNLDTQSVLSRQTGTCTRPYPFPDPLLPVVSRSLSTCSVAASGVVQVRARRWSTGRPTDLPSPVSSQYREVDPLPGSLEVHRKRVSLVLPS